MKYSHYKFLFLLTACAALGQQAPPPSAAEAALRARAEQFFQLQVDKKYRQAESLVASESKDDYYNGSKYSIKGFTIDKIELLDNNTRAKVTIKAKVTIVMPAAAGAFDLTTPSTSNWKLENGEWVWFIDTAAGVPTPFGTIKPVQESSAVPDPGPGGKLPDLSAAKSSVLAQLKNAVKLDRDSVVVTDRNGPQTVTISNDLPGDVDLNLGGDQIPGLSSTLEKTHLRAGEKAVLRLAPDGKNNGKNKGTGTVRVFVSPIDSELAVQVTVN